MADQEKPKSTKAEKAPEKTTKDAAKTETVAAEGAEGAVVKKVKKSKSKRTVTEGKAFIQSSFNNTIITITDDKGAVLGWSSAGTNGFKGAKKATPYAAQISAEAAINKALPYGLEKLHVFVKGLGSGREQAIRGLYTSGVSIESITDVTPVSHNGCRPRKARRV
ncbi:MAG: 30S ribosomal protein S11 [Candidatus Altimarinota bacterium]